MCICKSSMRGRHTQRTGGGCFRRCAYFDWRRKISCPTGRRGIDLMSRDFENCCGGRWPPSSRPIIARIPGPRNLLRRSRSSAVILSGMDRSEAESKDPVGRWKGFAARIPRLRCASLGMNATEILRRSRLDLAAFEKSSHCTTRSLRAIVRHVKHREVEFVRQNLHCSRIVSRRRAWLIRQADACVTAAYPGASGKLRNQRVRMSLVPAMISTIARTNEIVRVGNRRLPK